ncbi:hypothetical protein CLV35_2673 [Motilibacter peucedani]|uniref:ARB-07466-like C-terminal domain-containing protein n=1 Tax=Motilibacter peucedani TaxID=598650 RepID=A0A420XM35_9ACTN|nr:hypothetical protein [Motilibacter peucedani]RKS72429.1 hypothetical protein CLV35_2673 [Motilibacter peucedani]
MPQQTARRPAPRRTSGAGARPRPRTARTGRAKQGRDLRWLAALLIIAFGLLVVAGAQRLVSALLPDSLPFVPSSKACTVTVGSTEVGLDRDQAANAATIAGVGTRLGMPQRAVTIAIATALQESKLRNLDHGDRDSLGLFQQRPSQGWGTARQVQDPVYSSTKFYRALDGVEGWERLSLTRAAQAVQRSALPSAYAKHEPQAAALANALTGHTQAALTCRTSPAKAPRQSLTGTGLTTRANSVRSAMEAVWGKQSLGGFEPGGVSTGHIEDSAHYEGRAIDVFFRPASTANRLDGWAMAHWMVANSARLELATVIYDDHIWSAARSSQGWRRYVSDDPTNAIKQHRDHVHVDVVRGG